MELRRALEELLSELLKNCYKTKLIISCICISICLDGVVIAAQCTATFLRSIVLPRIWVLGRGYVD